MIRSAAFAALVVLSSIAPSPVGSALAAPFAYISHSVGPSRYVAVIDTATNTVVAQVPTPGSGGYGVAVDAAGTRAYIASRGTNSYWVIDATANSFVAAVPAGEAPTGIAVNPAGTRLFLTNKDSLFVFDTSTNKTVASTYVGDDPYGVVVNRTGTRVYVAASRSNQVTVLDAATVAIVARVPIGAGTGPIGLSLDRLHDRLYVANSQNGTVAVIDTTLNTVVKTIAVGAGINAVAVNPAGTRVFAADGGGQVAVIDTSTHAVVARIPVAGLLVGIAVNGAGTYCYVVDTTNNRVVVIDTGTNTVVTSIPVGQGPIALGDFIGPTRAKAVEYIHAVFGHYFVTANTDEIGKLDAGTFAGWARTGEAFNVAATGSPGTLDVCRFFTEKFPPSSSHFYTPFAEECAQVKANPDWAFEGLVFGVGVPDAIGACAAGSIPLYRYYNNGMGGAPNHRYTTSTAIGATMSSLGWTLEGVGACVAL